MKTTTKVLSAPYTWTFSDGAFGTHRLTSSQNLTENKPCVCNEILFNLLIFLNISKLIRKLNEKESLGRITPPKDYLVSKTGTS